jgi:hypothetical protein
MSDSRDHVGVGVAMGCAVQVGFFILGIVAALATSSSTKFSNVVAVSWGVTQWIALVPLILHERSAGRPRRVTGLIIAGCIGILLSSACASLMIFGK